MSETPIKGAAVSTAGFIGRAAELAVLEASLEDARAAIPRLVVLSGESGVGKSRLLGEFRALLDERGATSLGGECFDLGEDELPYAPLVGALRPLARRSDPVFDEICEPARCELSRLVPELGESPPSPENGEQPAEAQRKLFDSLLRLLDVDGGERPVVFWLEDVHWADRSTRSFISFLARSLREERVLVVLTLRSDELHRRHPMRPLIAELARLPNASVVELSRFSQPELRDQLHAILGADPEPAMVERMYARSEGNPLFTEQLLAGGLDGRAALPPTLRDALLLRLERLDDCTQGILRALAIVGRADESILAAAAVEDVDAVRAGVRDAAAANIVDTGDDGSFRFRHALLREVIYDDLLPGERAEGHLAVAKALQANIEGEPSVGLGAAVAHHFNASGAQDEAIRSAVVAARAAVHVHADAEAAALLDRVLALWPRVDDAAEPTGLDHPAMRAWAGSISFSAAQDLRAMALYEQAAEEMEGEADQRRRAEVLGRLASVQWTQGMADRALETLDRALELVPDDADSERAKLLSHRVRISLLRGSFGDVIRYSAEALEALRRSGPGGPQEIRISVLNRLGTAQVAIGEIEKGEQTLREAVEAGEGSEWKDELGTAYANYSDAMAIIGRPDQAERIARLGIEAMTPGGRPHRWLRMQLSDILFQQGRWDEAAAELPATAGALSGMFLVCFDLYSAQLALGRGELETARSILGDAHGILRDSIEPQFISNLAAMQADLELLCGDIQAARDVVQSALDRLEFCTEDELRFLITSAVGVAVEAEAAVRARDLGSADDERDARDRADRMIARVEATAPEADDGACEQNPLAMALATEAAAEYGRAIAADDEAERWLSAAEARNVVCWPYREGRARSRLAQTLLAAGDREGASRELAAAQSVIAGLGESRLAAELESFAARGRLKPAEPAAEGAPRSEERPFGLTEREMQVIVLLAEGQTNREIAEQLFMAEKTASVHVSRILSKLDVKSRTEAAAVAHRQGLAAPARQSG
ncbi:LuxR family transcriptional regulator [soil metagenome]